MTFEKKHLWHREKYINNQVILLSHLPTLWKKCKCYGGTFEIDILVCWDIYFNVNVKVCFRLEGLNNLPKTTMHQNKSLLGCHGPEKVQPWIFRCELLVSREVAAEGNGMMTYCILLPVNSIALSMYVHCLCWTMYLYLSSTCVAHCGAAWVFLVGGLEKAPSCRGYLQGSCIGSWWIPVINEPTLAEIHIVIVSPNQLAKTRLCHVLYPIQDSMFMFFLVNTHVSFPGEVKASQSPSTNDVSPSFQVTGRTGCFGQVGDWVAINPIRSPEVFRCP